MTKVDKLLYKISNELTLLEINELKQKIFNRPIRDDQRRIVAEMINNEETTKYIMLKTSMTESYVMKLKSLMKRISIDIMDGLTTMEICLKHNLTKEDYHNIKPRITWN